jgi:hypothetical protein
MQQEQQTRQHAMAMDMQDRANAQARFNQMLGLLGGAYGGSSASPMGGEYLDAENRLKSLLDDPESIKQTGAYKFRVGQGQEALQRSLGARGLLGSGNRLMELTKYGQDMASQEYDTQFSRLADLLGRKGQERAAMFGSLAGNLGGTALGGGGTGDIWEAYRAPRTASVVGSYEQNRQKSFKPYSSQGLAYY